MFRICVLVCIVFLSSCSSSSRFSGDAPADENLRKFKFFEGSWKCHSQWTQEEPEKVSVEYKGAKSAFHWVLGGHWMQGDYSNQKAELSQKSQCFYGYDSFKKVYLKLCLGDYDGWSFGESAGWIDQELKFVGKSRFNGNDLETSQSFKILSDHTYQVSSAYQAQGVEVRAQARSILTCQRVRKRSASKRHLELIDSRH